MVRYLLNLIKKFWHKCPAEKQASLPKKKIQVIRSYDLEVDRQRKLKAEQEENALPHPADDSGASQDYNGR